MTVRLRLETRTAMSLRPSESTLGKLPIADALRTLAIFLVVVNHLVWFSRPEFHGRPLALSYIGGWGVNCFFVLSGFLLSPPYIRSLLNATPLPSTTKYLRRRFFRIYPLYAVAVVASFVAAPLYGGENATWLNAVLHLLMLHGLWVESVIDPNSPLWTMPVDICFYIALPALAYTANVFLKQTSRKVRLRAIWASIGTIVVACLVYRSMAFRAFPNSAYDFATLSVFVRNIFGMSSSFAIGAGIALLEVLDLRINRAVVITLLVFSASIASIELFGRFQEQHTNFLTTILDPLAALSSGCLLAAGIFGLSAPVGRFLSAKLIASAAGIAYAVYVLHWPLIDGIQRHIFGGATGFLALIKISVVLPLLLIPLAVLAHRFIEAPFLKLNERERNLSAGGSQITQARTVP
jgi:peptidoglycan/LPS O-acetylase OafA/YrhL